MKKLIIIGIFILGMIIPNINVKAVDVSNEEELRNAIQQGGDITLKKNIEVTQPLVIDKDVNISSRSNIIMMQGDNTLITVNSGNVTLSGVILYAGWNGEYDEWGPDNIVKGQGKALVVNGGKVELRYSNINSGGTALILNKGSNITLNRYFYINSYEGNGIEVNDGSVVNINSTDAGSNIFGTQNAIYLNGGTANLSGQVGLSSSSAGHGIYINKGINTSTKGDVLNLKNDFIFSYKEGTTPNFSIYVNPDITELRVTDEKEFMELINNKLNLGFCGSEWSPMSQSEEDRKAICSNLNSNYDGPIESNELGKCAVVYINGEKQNEADASCNPVTDNENEPSQIVNVPATSAYASIIIIVLGIVCIIVSVIVTRKMTRKEN